MRLCKILASTLLVISLLARMSWPQEKIQERIMVSPAVSVSAITEYDEQSRQSEALLRLEDENTYLMSKQDRRFAIWQRIVRQQQATHGSLYVEYDPTTFMIQSLFLPSVRQIE